MGKNTPTQSEIDDVLNDACDATDEGRSRFPGMSYEQGVEYAIRWITEGGDHPFEDA